VLGEVAWTVPSISGDFTKRFQRKTLFFEAPASDTLTFRVIRKTEDGANATTFYIDSVEFITDNPTNLSRANPIYIDGDQLRCRWTGTPHASTSRRQDGWYVYITGLTESLRYVRAREKAHTVDSEITVQIREMT